MAVVAFGVRYANSAADTAKPSALRTTRIATFRQVADAAVSTVPTPFGFLSTIVRTVVAILACLADAVVAVRGIASITNPVSVSVGLVWIVDGWAVVGANAGGRPITRGARITDPVAVGVGL